MSFVLDPGQFNWVDCVKLACLCNSLIRKKDGKKKWKSKWIHGWNAISMPLTKNWIESNPSKLN